MTPDLVLDDPMLFSVWAGVDSENILRAAEHLATVVPLPLAQLYQMAKRSLVEERKFEVWSMRPYKEAMILVNELPVGFVAGTGVVAESVADPYVAAFCLVHSCFHGRTCSICDGDYL